MTRHRSATVQAVVAAAVLFGLAILPTAGIVAAARSGAVGTLPAGTWFAGPATLLVATFAVGGGLLVYRAVERGKRPGTVWSGYVDGLAVVVLGCWLIPFVLLFAFVDSDHSLEERGLGIVVAWFLAHAAVAGAALAVTRRLRT